MKGKIYFSLLIYLVFDFVIYVNFPVQMFSIYRKLNYYTADSTYAFVNDLLLPGCMKYNIFTFLYILRWFG